MPGARQHYHFLDFCRGVAALIVVLYHLSPIIGGKQYIASGFLSVDFFFILSGFVIAHAYEKKLRTTMGFGEFLLARIIRLYPMAVLGVAIGYLALLVGWLISTDAQGSLGELHAALLANILLLPKLWTSTSQNTALFPLDGALWSLFFELALNLLFALFIARLRNPAVFALAALGGLLTLAMALHVGTFNIGWNGETLVGGFARCLFGFCAGVLIFRYRHWLEFSWNGTGWLIVLILMLVPMAGANDLWTSALAVFVVFPASVALGTNVGWTSSLSLQKLSGNLSYPLYTMHLPIIGLAALAHQHVFPALSANLLQPILVATIIGAAYVAFYYIDVPVRRLLNRPADGGRTCRAGRHADALKHVAQSVQRLCA